MSSKKRKSNQLLLDVLVPPLPTPIWVYQVLPFLADRKSFNNLAGTSKEIHNLTQQLIAAKKITPPWPKTSIRVMDSDACSVAFSPDGGWLASGCRDGSVRIWNCADGRCIFLVGDTFRICSVKFSPDGNILASADSHGTIRLWTLADHSCQVLEGHEAYVRDIAFSPDGACLASGDFNGNLRLWDVNDGRCIRTWRDARLGQLYSIAFSPDGRMLASAGMNYGDGRGAISFTVLSDDVFTARIFNSIDDCRSVNIISFSPDGRYLVSVDYVGTKPTVRWWNVTDHSCAGSLPDQLDDRIRSISFSPNGKLLASLNDRSLQLWSVENKTCLLVLPNHDADGYRDSIAFTPDGQTLAIGGGDGVRLWNPDEERQRDKQFDWKEIVRLWKS